jgi:hypothetical protein
VQAVWGTRGESGDGHNKDMETAIPGDDHRHINTLARVFQTKSGVVQRKKIYTPAILGGTQVRRILRWR